MNVCNADVYALPKRTMPESESENQKLHALIFLIRILLIMIRTNFRSSKLAKSLLLCFSLTK